MRLPLLSALLSTAAALALAAAAHAQTDPTVLMIEGTGSAPADLVGQTVYATGGDADDVAGAPEGWTPVGVIEEIGASDEVVRIAFVAEVMPEGEAAVGEVPASQLRLIADADNPGRYFVLLDAEGTPLADRLADAGPSGEGASVSGGGEALEGDVVVIEPEPLDPAEAEPEVVVVEPEPLPETGADPQAEPLLEGEIPEAERLREVDITDPDAPPIEDATNVVPAEDAGDEALVPEIRAETEMTSPSHTAAVPGEETGGLMRPAAAPEDFSAVDMGTMDLTQLLGVRVYTLDDDHIGEIDRWVGEAPGRLPEGAVVNVGGFLGIGDREVAVGTDLMTLMAGADSNDLRVYVELTREQIEDLPELPD